VRRRFLLDPAAGNTFVKPRPIDERRVMERFTGQWCEFLLDRWQAATSFEYCVACFVIIVSGWLMSRATSRVGY
jgi:hypothetical protein